MINWHVSKEDHILIMRIVERIFAESTQAKRCLDMNTLAMDLTAAHANGTPLKLAELAEAEKFDLTHDVFGIVNHINRRTGQLEDCFLPRYAV